MKFSATITELVWEFIRAFGVVTIVIALFAIGKNGLTQENENEHTNNPAECKSYCYPKGYEGARPKGTPEGIPGYQCQGDHCAKAAEEGEENPCDEHGTQAKCTKWCAKPCCTCLAVCL